MLLTKEQKKGIVFNIQKYSIHDGPGIRTIVFLKGCPLNCQWCSNPESNLIEPEIMYNHELCVLCKQCISICPNNALELNKKKQMINLDRSKCNKCGLCTDNCPVESLFIAGQYMTVTEVMKEVKKDILFYRNSGGGLTLSGGEPCYQPDFAEEILQSAYSLGIHTAIETCGYYSFNVLKRFIKCTDLFMYDIKHVNDNKHIKGTGVSNEIILNNFKKLLDTGVSLIVRIPVIPGFNSTADDMRMICDFLSGHHGFKEIHLLPFHRLGDSKVIKLGGKSRIKRRSASNKELDKFKDIYKQGGFKVQIGG